MNIALILSGGVGTRVCSEIPKQYIEVCGKSIISYCIDVFAKHDLIDKIQIVADNHWHDIILKQSDNKKISGFSKPGENRQLSIYNGLRDIRRYAEDDDIVVIHDAARPLVTERLITDCIEAAAEHDGALPVIAMKDTMYYSEDGKNVSSLLQRDKLFAGQAPEAFKIGKYLEANELLLPDKILQINGSTEPAVLAGMDIALINGDEQNFKITTKEDLVRFERIMENIK